MTEEQIGRAALADMVATMLGTKKMPIHIKRVPIQTRRVVDGIVQEEHAGKKARTARSGSKTEAAQKIYDRMNAQGATRQEVVKAFVAELGLSPAGANTYFYNCSKK